MVDKRSACSSDSNSGAVIKNEMLCQFTLYNGVYCDDSDTCKRTGDELGVKTFWAPCAGGSNVWYDVEENDSYNLIDGVETPNLLSDPRFNDITDSKNWM